MRESLEVGRVLHEAKRAPSVTSAPPSRWRRRQPEENYPRFSARVLGVNCCQTCSFSFHRLQARSALTEKCAQAYALMTSIQPLRCATNFS